MSELILRTDGTFTIIFANSLKINGTFNPQKVDNTLVNIFLTTNNKNYGSLTKLTITNSYISFTFESSDCNAPTTGEGDRDKTYDESQDPDTLKNNGNCKITPLLTEGPQEQAKDQNTPIDMVTYSFDTSCTDPLTATAVNLPEGVKMSFSNNQAKVSGIPTTNASGTYNYIIRVQSSSTSMTVVGIIKVNAIILPNKPPSVPKLSAPDNGATITASLSLNLSWEASTDPDGDAITYGIYLGTTKDAGSIVSTTTTTNFTTGMLVEKTTYYWRIGATDTAGDTVYSEVRSFTTSEANNPPSVPVLASPTQGGSAEISSVKLLWNRSTDPENDAITYNVYWGKNNPPRANIVKGRTFNTYPIDDNQLTVNTTYYWQVEAVDSKGAVTTSAISSFIVAANTPPSPTSNVYTGNVTLTTQQEVDDFGAKNYMEITGSLTINGTSITNIDALSTLTSVGGYLRIGHNNDVLANLDGLSSLTSIGGYLWVAYNNVLANLDGLSSLTSIGEYLLVGFNNALVNLDGLFGLTSVPTIIVRNNNALTSLNGLSNLTSVSEYLSITNNNALASLNGLSSITSLGPTLFINRNAILADFCSLRTVLIGKTFSNYGVYANAYNPSQIQIQSSMTCSSSGNQPPTVPSLSTPANGTTLTTTNTAALAWTASTDPNGGGVTYDVFLGTTNPPTTVAQPNVATTLYNASSLSSNTTYYWQVVAKDSRGGVASSTIRSFTTTRTISQNRPPTVPSLSTPANGTTLTTSNTAALAWTASTDPDGDTVTYDVLLGNTSPPTTVAQPNVATTLYNASSLSSGTTYYWQVVAKDSRGGVASSTIRNFITRNNVYTGNVTLTTQQEVDDFGAKGYTRITGNLAISGTTIANIDALSSLTSVRYIDIRNNTILTNLNGLSNITLVEDTFYIGYNNALTSLNGLSNITSLGYINISSNNALTSLNGLSSSLTSLRVLVVQVNNALTNLNGLSSITSLGYLTIDNNTKLTDFCGLRTALINTSYRVTGNAYNPTQAQIRSILTCMSSLTAPSLSTPADGTTLTTTNTAALAWTASTDPNGGAVTYDVLLGNTNPPTTVAQRNVATTLYNASSLSSGTTYYWQVVAKDTNGGVASSTIRSFNTRSNVYQGSIVLSTQQEVDNFVGYTSITGSLTITGSSITNLNTLSNLTSIGGYLNVVSTTFTNINGLSTLTSVVGTISISNNAALTNLSGLSNITSITLLTIKGNSTLTNLSGLSSSLTSIQVLTITDNNALTSLNGLPSSLTSLRTLYVWSNNALTSLNGLSNITSLDNISILSNNALTNLNGLASSLISLNSISIYRNNALTSLNGLSSITSLGYLTIDNNTKLTDFCGLRTALINTSYRVTGNAYNPTQAQIRSVLTCMPSLTVPSLSTPANGTTLTTTSTAALAWTASTGSNGGTVTYDVLLGNTNPPTTVAQSNVATTLYNASSLTISTTYYWQVVAKDSRGGVASSTIRSFNIRSNVYQGSIVLSTQQEVDNFVGYTSITGSLTITGSSITNLNTLSNLTSVGGYLNIFGTTFTNVNALSTLNSVGYINISNNTVLTNLSGLSNISSVGELLISLNNALTNLDGLSSLTSVTFNLSIRSNNVLASLNGLSNLTSIGGYLDIIGNNVLTNLDGLSSSLASTSLRGINVSDNSALTSLNGLSNITSTGNLFINRNNVLANLDGLSNLTSILYLSIVGNNALTSFCGIRTPFINKVFTSSNYTVSGNAYNPTQAQIRSVLTCMPSLTVPSLSTPANGTTLTTTNTAALVWTASTDPNGGAVTYDVLLGNTSPPTTVAQPNVATTLYNASSLTVSTTYYWQVVAKDSRGGVASSTIRSFTTTRTISQNRPPTVPSLSTPANGTTLTTSNTAALAWTASTDPDGDTVTYDVLLGNTNPLTTVAQRNVVTTLYNASSLSLNTTYYWQVIAKDSRGGVASSTIRRFNTRSNVYQGSINLTTQQEVDNFGANGYTRITATLTISGTSITNINALAGLTSVGSLFIRNNNMLTNLNGLSGLVTVVSGDLTIQNNNALVNIDGLSNLTSVGRHLSITKNTALTNVDGLSSLTSVGNVLSFRDNSALTNINGLSGITSVGDGLYIQTNSALTNVDGLSSLTSVGGDLYIQVNGALTNINGLSSLTSIGEDIRIDRVGITTLTGLSSLVTVTGGFFIASNTKLTSLTGVSSLTSIGGDFNITNNQLVTNLNGFSSLTSIGGDFYINGNRALTDYCSVRNLFTSKTFSRYTVSANAYNPTQAQISSATDCRQ